MIRKLHHPSGFILVLTLILLALAAVLLAGLTLESTTRAFEVVVAQEHLQRKWGIASIEQVVWERADALLALSSDEADAASGQPWRSGLYTLTLGGMRFSWILQDEQAKLNLNAIYRERGLEAVHRLMRGPLALSSQGVAIHLHPNLHAIVGSSARALATGSQAGPDEARSSSSDQPPAFGAWAEIYESFDPAQLGGFPADHASRRLTRSLTAEITCWGDGRLNLTRTRGEILASRSEGLLTARQADALVQWAAQQPPEQLARWLEGSVAVDAVLPETLDNPAQDGTVVTVPRALNSQADQAPIDAAAREAIAPFLTTQSTCFSMAMQIITPQHTEYQWLVHRGGTQQVRNASEGNAAGSSFLPFPGTLRFIWP